MLQKFILNNMAKELTKHERDTPNEMLFNKYIDMFEFRGAVKEKEN